MEFSIFRMMGWSELHVAPSLVRRPALQSGGGEAQGFAQSDGTGLAKMLGVVTLSQVPCPVSGGPSGVQPSAGRLYSGAWPLALPPAQCDRPSCINYNWCNVCSCKLERL